MSARTNRLLAPYAAGLTALVLAPALLSLGFAFFRYNLVQAPTFVGLQNFSALLDSDIFRTSLRVSLLFLLFAVPFRAIGAIGLGLLYHRRMRGGSVHRSAVLLPVVMPDVAYALVWIWILNPFYGPLNVALRAVGIDPPLWLTTPGTAQMAVIMMVVFQLGEGFLIALAARQMFERGLPHATELGPRGTALTMLGLTAFLAGHPEVGPAADLLARLATRLCRQYRQEATAGWRWFEPALTYDNALLPLALWRAHALTQDPESRDVARAEPRERGRWREPACSIGPGPAPVRRSPGSSPTGCSSAASVQHEFP
jgi:hypothetical protein